MLDTRVIYKNND